MISKQIELLRRKNGWSQADLAQRLHVSPSTVGMYEQGCRSPSVDTLVAMSKEFGVTLDYLVAGNDCALPISAVDTQEPQAMEAISVLKYLSREELMVLLVAELLNPI